MRRSSVLRGLAALLAGAVACTDVVTDPDAVVAIQFDGAAYPSIVLGDSLRDSLGAILPLSATALNYRGDAIPDAPIEFASPDTALQIFTDGVVYARTPGPDGGARLFATAGALQSADVPLVIVPRADSIRANKEVDSLPPVPAGIPGVATADTGRMTFTVFGDGEGADVVPVRSWLVSFQLRFRGTLLAPSDTSIAYLFEASRDRRIVSWIDTTGADGAVSRRVFVRASALGAGEDTIAVIATLRERRAGSPVKQAQTLLRVRRAGAGP